MKFLINTFFLSLLFIFNLHAEASSFAISLVPVKPFISGKVNGNTALLNGTISCPTILGKNVFLNVDNAESTGTPNSYLLKGRGAARNSLIIRFDSQKISISENNEVSIVCVEPKTSFTILTHGDQSLSPELWNIKLSAKYFADDTSAN